MDRDRYTEANRKEPDMATKPLPVHGSDISHHQGSVNLEKAKSAGLRWLYHKATEGDSWVDDRFKERRAAAAKAGLPFGAYHFARPERGDAVAEALRFLAVAKPQPGDLRPALDLETDEGLSMNQIREWARAFVDRVHAAIGVYPIVYTPFALGDVERDCLIWRPRYNNTNTPPVLPWDIWQFSNGVFGKPNSFPGLGKVDLNTMAKDLRMAQMLIPKPKPEPQETRVHLAHASLQFGDTDKQHTSDLEAIFTRLQQRGVHVIGGTEAGPGSGNTPTELLRVGAAHGYRMWVPNEQVEKGSGSSTDCWLGVREDFILGDWETGFQPAIPGSAQLYKEIGKRPDLKPRWGPKGVVWAGWESPLGPWTHAVAHYLTKARNPGATTQGIDHWKWNRRLTEVIGDLARERGKGKALFTYSGDQNMADSKNDEPQGDTFMGQPLTSLGDELEKWFNTGHGPIDVIATYNADKRISAAYWRVLNDQRFPLATDHFYCEGGIDVKDLRV